MYLGESLSRNELGKYKYRHTIPEFIFILTVYKKQLSGQMTLKWARHSYSLILSDSTEDSLEWKLKSFLKPIKDYKFTVIKQEKGLQLPYECLNETESAVAV